jgi:hypothetical protein
VESAQAQSVVGASDEGSFTGDERRLAGMSGTAVEGAPGSGSLDDHKQ